MSEEIATRERAACPRCDRLGTSLYRDLSDRSYAVPGEWELLTCAGCGITWISPEPVGESLAALYAEYFTHRALDADDATSALSPPEAKSWWLGVVHRAIPAALGHDRDDLGAGERFWGHLLSRVGPLRELAQQSVMWLPAPAGGATAASPRLLDVGCGDGTLLQRMRARGWHVAGVETDPAAAGQARRRLDDAAIHAGPLAEAPFPEDFFDAVTLYHVIEHLTDPSLDLARCHSLLRPGGRLVLSTPNSQSLGRQRFERDWLHWDPPRHLRIFDAPSLCAALQEVGFRIDRVFTPACSALPVWRGSSLIRDKGRLPGVDVSGASWATSLVGMAFWGWEYFRTRSGQLCGEDLVVVAHRPTREEARGLVVHGLGSRQSGGPTTALP